MPCIVGSQPLPRQNGLHACNCNVDPECRKNLPGCPDTQLSLLLPRFVLQPLAVPADTRGALRQAAVCRILAAGGAGLDPLRDAALAHLVTQVLMFLSTSSDTGAPP